MYFDQQTGAFHIVPWLKLCESEPVSYYPYLQIQAQAKRHLINYLCVHPMEVNMSVILCNMCYQIAINLVFMIQYMLPLLL